MAKVDWSYHRAGCKTCGKTAAYLAEHHIAVAEQVDARKVPLVEQDALQLVGQVRELYATRGRSVVHLDLAKEQPDPDVLRSLLIGPSGKLRAPTLKKGKTLVVGFDEATYAKVFG